MCIRPAFSLLLVLSVASLRGSSAGLAPRIDQHPNSVTVNMSDPVTLECRASGDPRPKITWYKDGVRLSLDFTTDSSNGVVAAKSKYTLIHDSDLFIFAAMLGKGNKSDTGVYYCRADNQHGHAVSHNASIVISCKSK